MAGVLPESTRLGSCPPLDLNPPLPSYSQGSRATSVVSSPLSYHEDSRPPSFMSSPPRSLHTPESKKDKHILPVKVPNVLTKSSKKEKWKRSYDLNPIKEFETIALEAPIEETPQPRRKRRWWIPGLIVLTIVILAAIIVPVVMVRRYYTLIHYE
jgi:hypothetical protein